MEGFGTVLQRLLDALDGGVQQHYEQSGSGFRPRFYPVAQQLLGAGTLSIRSISGAIGLSHSAVSQTVSAMHAAGLVTIAPAAEDGRQRLVQLTPKGRATCQGQAALWSAVARAADELNNELPMSLDLLARAALSHLQQESFSDRIARHVRVLADELPTASAHPAQLET